MNFQHIINLTEGLKNKYFPIFTRMDGNCLYYSISKLLFGCENGSYILRLSALFILIEFEKYFIHLLSKTYDSMNFNEKFNELVLKTSSDYEWGC